MMDRVNFVALANIQDYNPESDNHFVIKLDDDSTSDVFTWLNNYFANSYNDNYKLFGYTQLKTRHLDNCSIKKNKINPNRIIYEELKTESGLNKMFADIDDTKLTPSDFISYQQYCDYKFICYIYFHEDSYFNGDNLVIYKNNFYLIHQIPEDLRTEVKKQFSAHLVYYNSSVDRDLLCQNTHSSIYKRATERPYYKEGEIKYHIDTSVYKMKDKTQKFRLPFYNKTPEVRNGIFTYLTNLDYYYYIFIASTITIIANDAIILNNPEFIFNEPKDYTDTLESDSSDSEFINETLAEIASDKKPKKKITYKKLCNENVRTEKKNNFVGDNYKEVESAQSGLINDLIPKNVPTKIEIKDSIDTKVEKGITIKKIEDKDAANYPLYCSNSLYGAEKLSLDDYKQYSLTCLDDPLLCARLYSNNNFIVINGFRHLIKIIQIYSYDAKSRLRTNTWLSLMYAIHNLSCLTTKYKLSIIKELEFYKINSEGDLTDENDSRNYKYFVKHVEINRDDPYTLEHFFKTHFNLRIEYNWKKDPVISFGIESIETNEFISKEWIRIEDKQSRVENFISLYNDVLKSKDDKMIEGVKDIVIKNIYQLHHIQNMFVPTLSSVIRCFNDDAGENRIIIIKKSIDGYLTTEVLTRNCLQAFSDKIFKYYTFGEESQKWRVFKKESLADVINSNPSYFLVTNIEFYNEIQPVNSINTWLNWAYQGKITSIKFNPDIIKCWTQVALNRICSGDINRYNYFISWLQFILKNPGKQTGTAIIIHGEQGAGKDFILSGFERLVVGYNFITSKTDDIGGQFNSYALHNKVFVRLNEAPRFSEKSSFADTLKTIITDPKVTIERKHGSKMVVKNTANLIITTNHKDPIKMESTDRRFTIFRTNGRMSEEEKLLAQKYFEDPNFREVFYGHLHYYIYNFKVLDDNGEIKKINIHQPMITEEKTRMVATTQSREEVAVALLYYLLKMQCDYKTGNTYINKLFKRVNGKSRVLKSKLSGNTLESTTLMALVSKDVFHRYLKLKGPAYRLPSDDELKDVYNIIAVKIETNTYYTFGSKSIDVKREEELLRDAKGALNEITDEHRENYFNYPLGPIYIGTVVVSNLDLARGSISWNSTQVINKLKAYNDYLYKNILTKLILSCGSLIFKKVITGCEHDSFIEEISKSRIIGRDIGLDEISKGEVIGESNLGDETQESNANESNISCDVRSSVCGDEANDSSNQSVVYDDDNIKIRLFGNLISKRSYIAF